MWNFSLLITPMLREIVLQILFICDSKTVYCRLWLQEIIVYYLYQLFVLYITLQKMYYMY